MIRPGERLRFFVDGKPKSAVVETLVFRGNDRYTASIGEQYRELLVVRTVRMAIIVRDRLMRRTEETKPDILGVRWYVYDAAAAAAHVLSLGAAPLTQRAVRALRDLQQAVEV